MHLLSPTPINLILLLISLSLTTSLSVAASPSSPPTSSSSTSLQPHPLGRRLRSPSAADEGAAGGARWAPRPPSSVRIKGQGKDLKRSIDIDVKKPEVNILPGRGMDLVHEKSKRGRMDRRGVGKRDVGEFGREVAIIEGLGEHAGIYTIPIMVGTQPLSLQLDLASSDILLPSTLCNPSSCPHISSKYISTLYNPSLSSSSDSSSNTFQPINSNTTTFNLTFTDTSFFSGFLARESISLQISTELTAQEYVVKGQVVGVVNATDVDLEGEGIRGVVGFGFSRLSQFARIGLGLGLGDGEGGGGESISAAESGTVTRSASLASAGTVSPSSSGSSSGGEEEITFSILPVPEITPYVSTAGIPTTTAAGRKRQATTSSSSASASSSSTTQMAQAPYYPPLLENLFNPPTSNKSDPILAYPVFSIALANSSAPFGVNNSNASIVIGGVSAEYVLPTGNGTEGEEEADGRETVDDIEWYEVVPFGRANGLSANEEQDEVGMTLEDLEDEAYLYWALELANITMNGTSIPLSPTYNTSFTGLTGSGSIALLDIGTNGIFGPQQDVIDLFLQIPNSRQVSPGQWIAPCSTKQTMTFQFKLPSGEPGLVIELQPSEWLSAQIEGSDFCLAWPVALPPSADGMDWQLGTPLLRKMYWVFGYGISGVQGAMVGLLPLPSPVGQEEGGGNNPGGVVTASASSDGSATGSATPTIGFSGGNTPPTSTRATNDPKPTSIQAESEVRSLLTVTITTILPNVLLPNPSYTTPPYAFNTSATPYPTPGVVQTMGLANGTIYQVAPVPVFTSVVANATATGTTNPGNGNNAGSGGSGGSGGARGTWGVEGGAVLAAGLVFVGALVAM